MEHQKPVIICALYAVPHYLAHFPRKVRSQIIRTGPKKCLDFNDTSLSRKRRKVMFNETDMASVELNVTIYNSRAEGDDKENRVMIFGTHENEEPSLLLPESPHGTGKTGKSILDSDISTPRKRKGKMVHEEDQVDRNGVVGPQTPSPAKRRRARGSKNRGGNLLRSDAMTKKTEEKMLTCVAKTVESAHYYTRTLNNLVINELVRENELNNQPNTDTHQQLKTIDQLVDDKRVSLKGPKKKIKKILVGPNVARDTTKAWRVLLSNGSAESIISSRNKDNGICREVSFIQKVGSIQGPRVHLPWKGSVLDSVIGALLTQRVGDNISSSAFMSLGMVFPQYPACDLYSRHHRITREKRSIACSSQQSSVLKSTVNFLHKSGNVSKFRETSRKGKVIKKEKPKHDWKNLRKTCIGNGELERDADKIDSVDWHAVMRANVDDIADAILFRGMNKKLATRIKDFLNRLVLDHRNLDLEWLRNADSQEAKDFLLSIYGIGIKSAECVRLLTLRQPAFPVDINVARVTVRLGWVPAPSISDDIQMYLLEQTSNLHDLIHQYLWPRLSKLDNETLHQLHCHMITFGKVFCTKQKPNCGECPMRLDCRYYSNLDVRPLSSFQEMDIEDLGNSRTGMIKAKPSMSIRETERKKCKVKETAIVALVDDCIEALKTPVKLPLLRSENITSKKNTSVKVRQRGKSKPRTKHFIYELPDWHPILESFDDRDPDDLSPYLLVTWKTDLEKTGETSDKKSPSSSRVKGSRVVPGTIMIPCRTALRGNFPLNATYFQANEVFADQQTSRIPVDVRCRTLMGLPRKKLYCGTNLTGITKGRSANEIRRLFREGYICTRIFDRETCATRTLDGQFTQLHYTRKWNLKRKGC